MGVRSILELSLDKPAERPRRIEAFLQKYPENPVALGQSAVVKVLQGKPQEAIRSLAMRSI